MNHTKHQIGEKKNIKLNHTKIIRRDILQKLERNEGRLGKIKSQISLQILLYPYMKKLQKERNELLSDPDFLWMVANETEMRAWETFGYDHNIHTFFIKGDDYDGITGLPDLDDKYRVDLLTPISEEIFTYRQIQMIKGVGILVGLGILIFLVFIGIFSIIGVII